MNHVLKNKGRSTVQIHRKGESEWLSLGSPSRLCATIVTVVSATAAVGILLVLSFSDARKSASLLPYDESAIVKFPSDIPWQILRAAQNERSLWIRYSIHPDHYIRMNGYTCVVWKWPTATWDPELNRLSDERRIWVKDDIAKVVPTPPFFLSMKAKARPPRLTAAKAAAIAEMKTGLLYRSTNSVDDVGDFFKITFTPRLLRWKDNIEQWEALPFETYAWVSKSDWSVCGNPFSPVPSLTMEEAISTLKQQGVTLSYDNELPIKTSSIADLTIVSLPKRFRNADGMDITNQMFHYWKSFCIDNATRNIIGSTEEAN